MWKHHETKFFASAVLSESVVEMARSKESKLQEER